MKVRLLFSGEVEALTDRRGFSGGHRDGRSDCGADGRKFRHRTNGRFIASARIGAGDRLVRVRARGDAFRVHRAYSHRCASERMRNMASNSDVRRELAVSEEWACFACGGPSSCARFRFPIRGDLRVEVPCCPKSGSTSSRIGRSRKMAEVEQALEDK
jgi:hypothetical protein